MMTMGRMVHPRGIPGSMNPYASEQFQQVRETMTHLPWLYH